MVGMHGFDSQNRPMSPDQEDPSAPAPESTRVLVADGNPISRDVLLRHLEGLGYAVDLARDGDHALAMAASGEYQVMLLDVHMPVFDGVEIMRRLHLVMGRSLRVIAIAADKPANRDQIGRMGVDGFLARPVDVKRLDQELRRVLLKSRR